MDERIPTFPDGFLFGAATASYQIEGAVKEDGRGQSIWDTFSATPGKTENGDTGEVACDHYHRVPEDVAIMRELGLDAYRFSVAWPRIQADGTGAANPLGLAFYDRLVDELLGAGIRPVVTLYHWDLPQALEDRGGWRTREVADRFADYAAHVVGALGDRVRNWTTLNEPWCSAFLGHTIGVHAPGHTDPMEGLLSAHHLMLAHGRAVPVIREHCPDAEVSITLNPSQVHGPEDATEADLDAVRRVDNALNGVFFGPLFHGAYPDGYLDDVAHLTDGSFVHDGDLETISARLDNLGVNNYFPARVRATPEGATPEGNTHLLPGCEQVDEIPPHPPLTAMGWEQSAPSHRMIVERSARECGLPVYVTENGSAWDDVVSEDGAVHDPERVDYLRQHLAALADSVAAGTDLRGYFAWSLLDNFEWAYGYDKRFGIVHVDYDTQVRTVKDSGREYARVIAAHRPE
ncbi:GH1 family beta-glucosidase [Phycicoccus flavus]|uniref:GH1 family beta-glucosidase n=1 Tax=Phycicoccus flavus TaxID=2502783 RepID=UPI000FEC0E0D|nr:GH1 family beta-glucosidase [Phycicoccus flavus]NHA69875.1 beta-glucosidase [Phycicoccus flavus]